ncbi:MAG: flagellar biosynthesis protein FlgM [Lysobacterales bacterium CG17_big_fil_post_rev_8_21_14_2_50_64_11]|nr:MAG: flagellar biosynthesis protein FlgM [Xanthomonadales bacterium CG17_big_fil_post_rev_8_21_14_2_50_64_11]PIX61447.1 MAG: flagellar biosynthesis protein FlgM [Xanthomonadales bacterium CG_4_10_14_3_um_filter_64_11]
MKWRGRRSSSHVDDQRRTGNGMRLPMGGRRPGGLMLVVLVIAAIYFGVDPSPLLQGAVAPASRPAAVTTGDDTLAQFVGVVLADTEDTWHRLLDGGATPYREPTLVLFSDHVRSACGVAGAAMGPFYCPADQRVYIDLGFYRALQERFGAPGDFAQAYVIAHEVGHHVQNLLGISSAVHARQQRADTAQANQLSVRLELQADCFAGIWANHAERLRDLLDDGDIDEALTAASAIGDDRLQQQAQGRVVPESFTHGSSAQRVHWFRVGHEQGAVVACDTFAADRP